MPQPASAALGAKIATTTIPIVFVTGVDPVATGLVPSLSRPGGNLTGVTDLAAELGQKHLELLRAVVTTARIVALLVNPANPNAKILPRELQAAGHKLGLVLDVLHASKERDFAEAFAVLSKLRADALVIGNAVKVMCIATLPKPRCSRHCAAGRPATASWAVSASSVGLD